MNSADAMSVPEGFLWGTAISAHQSEGNNVNSDAWVCENVQPTRYREPSGDACDSYNRWREDLEIASGLGLNCYRFGIEWSRIEPEPGRFSLAELDRYRRILETAHALGLKPMVTFSHFTVPRWFAAEGGFESADAPARFAAFAARATESLGDLIAYATTFNEANIPRVIRQVYRGPGAEAAIEAMLAPCRKAVGSDRFSSLIFAPVEATEENLVRAHDDASAAMKAGRGDFPVGVTLSMRDVQGIGEGHQGEALIDDMYGPWIEIAKAADFIGVQTYTRVRVGPDGPLPLEEGAELTSAGYEYYPEALAGTIRFAHERIGRPVYVTESGVATDDDARRIVFIDRALKAVRSCMEDGIPVHGYIYWSLLDNFEWTSGYSKHFGLVGVDLETFRRTPKPSAAHFGRIACAGVLP